MGRMESRYNLATKSGAQTRPDKPHNNFIIVLAIYRVNTKLYESKKFRILHSKAPMLFVRSAACFRQENLL